MPNAAKSVPGGSGRSSTERAAPLTCSAALSWGSAWWITLRSQVEQGACARAGMESPQQSLRRAQAVPGRRPLVGDPAEGLHQRGAGALAPFRDVRALGRARARRRRRHAAKAEPGLAAVDVKGGANRGD